jgi:hypothetical protein
VEAKRSVSRHKKAQFDECGNRNACGIGLPPSVLPVRRFSIVVQAIRVRPMAYRFQRST